MDNKVNNKKRVYVCPLCDKIQETLEEYIEHRLELCEKVNDENRENIREGLKQIGLL